MSKGTKGNGKAIERAMRPGTPAKGPVLPGQAAARQDLIDAAVREINRAYVTKGLETAKWIGEYVLKTFFEGKVENFRRLGRKHASFRKLGEREDLHVSYVFLWNCVGMVDQFKALPGEIANALPATHHTLLLPVHDEKAKLELAKKAVRQKMSSRELSAEVQKLRRRGKSNGDRRGRPAMTQTVRLLSALSRLATLARSAGVAGDAEVAALGPAKLGPLLGEADRDLAALKGLVDRVRSRIDGEQVPGGHAAM